MNAFECAFVLEPVGIGVRLSMESTDCNLACPQWSCSPGVNCMMRVVMLYVVQGESRRAGAVSAFVFAVEQLEGVPQWRLQ